MGAPSAPTVDVRDMLCAQALALVAKAVKRLPVGQVATICYNAEDVRRDVVTWAAGHGHDVQQGTETALRVTRRH